MENVQFVREILARGDAIMWLILISAVVAVFIILERLWHYHRAQIDVSEFMHGLFVVLRRNNAVEAVAICDETPGPVAHIMRMAILHCEDDTESLRRSVDEAALAEVPRLEKNLRVLATVAHVAPLLGLLGTVAGMIGLFQEIESGGTFVSTREIAGHVWKALLTTAAGFSVAVPVSVFYNFLLSRVQSILLDVDKAASEVIYFLTHNPVDFKDARARSESGGASPPTPPSEDRDMPPEDAP